MRRGIKNWNQGNVPVLTERNLSKDIETAKKNIRRIPKRNNSVQIDSNLNENIMPYYYLALNILPSPYRKYLNSSMSKDNSNKQIKTQTKFRFSQVILLYKSSYFR